MNPIHHPLCNDVLRAPEGATDCSDLPILRNPTYIVSFWKPSDEQLAALIAGGTVAVQCHSQTHPPISLGACKPSQDIRAVSDPEEIHVFSRVMKQKYDLMLSLLRRALTAWAKENIKSPELRAFTDELLDHSNAKSPIIK